MSSWDEVLRRKLAHLSSPSSVLSEDTDCCETLHNYAARIGLLLGPSCAGGQCSERLLAVLSRLGYMLGNILAKHESARIQVSPCRIL